MIKKYKRVPFGFPYNETLKLASDALTLMKTFKTIRCIATSSQNNASFFRVSRITTLDSLDKLYNENKFILLHKQS